MRTKIIMIMLACLLPAASLAGCVGDNESATPEETIASTDLYDIEMDNAILSYEGAFSNEWATFKMELPEEWWAADNESEGASLNMLFSLDFPGNNRPLSDGMEAPPENHIAFAGIFGETQSGLSLLDGVMTPWYAKDIRLITLSSELPLERIYLLLADHSKSTEDVRMELIPINEEYCSDGNFTLEESAGHYDEIRENRTLVNLVPDATGNGVDYSFYKLFNNGENYVEYAHNVEGGYSESEFDARLDLSCDFINLSKTTFAHTEFFVSAGSSFVGLGDSSSYSYSTPEATYDSYDNDNSYFGFGLMEEPTNFLYADTAQPKGNISFDCSVSSYGGSVSYAGFASIVIDVDFEKIYNIDCRDFVVAGTPYKTLMA